MFVLLQCFRAPRDGPRRGLGRHVCTATDGGGTHFMFDEGHMAYIQQILHAVSQMAIDKPAWRDTPWFRELYGDEYEYDCQ